MKSQTKYITGALASAGGIIALIAFFFASSHFSTEMEGDSACAGDFEEPCEWKYNVTLNSSKLGRYYIRNKDAIDISFVPDVKQSVHCKKDGRIRAAWRGDRSLHPCGLGWREFDWKTPLTTRYLYIERFDKNEKHRYKMVVFKYNPSDDIKFGGKITGEEFDPRFKPKKVKIQPIEECRIETKVKNINEPQFCKRDITYVDNSTGFNVTEKEEYWCGDKSVHHFVNKSVCEVVGYKYNETKVYCKRQGFRCSVDGDLIIGDSCNDGNCDRKIDSGETFFRLNTTNSKVDLHKDVKSHKGVKIE